VPDDHGRGCIQHAQRSTEQDGLILRRPKTAARALAVSEAGSVECDDAMAGLEQCDEPAEHKIPSHRAVAV